MGTKNGMTELRGVMVVSQKEGANLGQISHVFVDPETRAICGLSFKNIRDRGESYLDQKDIALIGRDVVLATTETAAKPLTKANPPGRSLKDLQGTWVITHDGKQLGTLVDLDIKPKDWTICEFRLADNKRLAVEPKKVILGPDQILVPPRYAEKVERRPSKTTDGFLGRVFGAESIEDLAKTIRRTLKSPRAQASPESKEETWKKKEQPKTNQVTSTIKTNKDKSTNKKTDRVVSGESKYR